MLEKETGSKLVLMERSGPGWRFLWKRLSGDRPTLERTDPELVLRTACRSPLRGTLLIHSVGTKRLNISCRAQRRFSPIAQSGRGSFRAELYRTGHPAELEDEGASTVCLGHSVLSSVTAGKGNLDRLSAARCSHTGNPRQARGRSQPSEMSGPGSCQGCHRTSDRQTPPFRCQRSEKPPPVRPRGWDAEARSSSETPA